MATGYQVGLRLGNYKCRPWFKPGSYQRSNANLKGQRFLAIESATLAKEEVGAVFAHFQGRLVAFGCDLKVFALSQPVRVPEVFSDARRQRLV